MTVSKPPTSGDPRSVGAVIKAANEAGVPASTLLADPARTYFAAVADWARPDIDRTGEPHEALADILGLTLHEFQARYRGEKPYDVRDLEILAEFCAVRVWRWLESPEDRGRLYDAEEVLEIVHSFTDGAEVAR